jgi:hypothetical protein
MWDYIHTHFGIGYRFDPQPVEPGADLAPGKARVMDEAELQDDEARAAETAEPAISEKAASD